MPRCPQCNLRMKKVASRGPDGALSSFFRHWECGPCGAVAPIPLSGYYYGPPMTEYEKRMRVLPLMEDPRFTGLDMMDAGERLAGIGVSQLIHSIDELFSGLSDIVRGLAYAIVGLGKRIGEAYRDSRSSK